MPGLTAAQADALLEPVLANLHREYPGKIVHSLESDTDARPPRLLTPLFFGCYDWHSAVHSHWCALSLLERASPALATEARSLLALSFTADKVAGELAYLESRPGFEMPYGMAWLLQLTGDFPNPVLAPLEQLAAQRFQAWLESLPYPIRTGQHSQSAFGMGLAYDWAVRCDHPLARTVSQKSLQLYGSDRDAPLAYEPSAYDFLSPSLAEADLMARLLSCADYADWLQGFLPEIDLRPVQPASRADGKLVHFDGLNLTRAWMLWGMARALPADHPRRESLLELAREHGRAGMTWLEGATYMGTHWLPSFSVYWLRRSGEL